MTAAAWLQNYAQPFKRPSATLIDCTANGNITDFGTFAGGTPVKSTDTAVTFNGNATTKVAIPQGVTRFDFGVSSGITPPLGWDGTMIVAVRVDEASRMETTGATFVGYAGDASYTNFFTGTYTGSAPVNYGYLNPGEWNYIKFMPERWATGGGSPTFASVARARVRVSPVAGSADFNMWFGGFFIPTAARATFAVVLDDGYDEHFDFVKGEAETYNVPVSFGIISELIGGAGYMTLANLQTLAANPDLFAIINHSKDDDTYSEVGSVAGMVSNFNACRDYILSNGLSVYESEKHIVYPGGGHDAALKAALSAVGYKTARNAASTVLVPYFPTYAPTDPQMFSLPLVDYLDSDRSLANVKASVDRVINYGGFGIINGHKFDAAAGTIQWAESDLTALFAYLALKRDQGLVDLVTIPNWHRGLTQPTLVA
jgi:hypothetical protein